MIFLSIWVIKIEIYGKFLPLSCLQYFYNTFWHKESPQDVKRTTINKQCSYYNKNKTYEWFPLLLAFVHYAVIDDESFLSIHSQINRKLVFAHFFDVHNLLSWWCRRKYDYICAKYYFFVIWVPCIYCGFNLEISFSIHIFLKKFFFANFHRKFANKCSIWYKNQWRSQNFGREGGNKFKILKISQLTCIIWSF